MHDLVSMIAHSYQRMPWICSDVGVITPSLFFIRGQQHVIPASSSNNPWRTPLPNARLPLSPARDSAKKPLLAAESKYFQQRTVL
jgi:hypothetical protein